VCPWNALAPASADPAWQPRPAWDQPQLSALEQMDDEQMRVALRGSPMKRTKLDGLRRNLRVVRANLER
jgi:epoxyqueuosine reductase